jgi:hypothetical protein
MTVTSTIDVTGAGTGTALMTMLNAGDIEPGSDVSYQLCKVIYLYHPLGGKMVDRPIKIAQSQGRDIAIPDGPEELARDAFEREWKQLKCDEHIANAMRTARIYGIGSLAYGAPNIPTNEPIDPFTLPDLDIYFSTFDPLNTAGSLVLDQNPNAPDFQKVVSITAGGQPYHRSRACVVMNEAPVYIAYSNSAFGFVGRSVYQRALFPMKSYIQTMITDDLVSLKAGMIVAKIKQAGSIVNNLMQKATALKRSLLQQGTTGNVLSIDPAEDIQTLDLTNVNQAMSASRSNIQDNIAAAADMPAGILKDEAFAEGFADGTEDAKRQAMFIDEIRNWATPLYEFMDQIVMYRAWNKAFYASCKEKFPEAYGKMSYEAFFQMLRNSFTAQWPSLLTEPESEKIKVDEVKLKSIIAMLEILMPQIDPLNKAEVIMWAQDNLNENKLLFTNPLELDFDALKNYVPPEPPPMPGEPNINR